jgi:hypothetical protein
LAGTWPTFRQDSPRPVKEHPDLRQAAAQAGLLLDHALGLPGAAGRVLQEVVLQRLRVDRQLALGPVEVGPPQGLEPAGQVLVEVALDGAAAEAGQASDLSVGQAAALEPEDLHFLLDTGVGVMEPLAAQGGYIRVSEHELPHGRPPSEMGDVPAGGVAIRPPNGKCQLWPAGV